MFLLFLEGAYPLKGKPYPVKKNISLKRFRQIGLLIDKSINVRQI